MTPADRSAAGAAGHDDAGLTDLIETVRDMRGFDFSAYKRPSLARRVGKRIDALHLDGYESYVDHIRASPSELEVLFDTVLIGVTSFRRDAATWPALQETLRQRISEKPVAEPVRAWVAGCSTGQEAFTVAMVLCDLLGEEAFRDRVKIYATDIDEGALAVARRGRYLPGALEGSPAGWAERYFVRDGDELAFRSDLRRAVIFGRHDLLVDPPISNLDLLTCRNTLMYFVPSSQLQVLERFHFGLRPGGILVLGRAETIANRTTQFRAVDLGRRIFASVREDASVPPRTARTTRRSMSGRDDIRSVGFDLAPFAQVLLDEHSSVIAVNDAGRSLFGIDDGALGRPVDDLDLASPSVDLGALVDVARTERRQAVARRVSRNRDDGAQWFDVVVSPIPGSGAAVAVAFVDATEAHRLDDELQRARADLHTAHEEIHAVIEELETTNEELQSTNEELETTNEELQSTNEELETMNEELQSTNDELGATNEALRQRTDELDGANAFLGGVLSSINSAVIVVDREMRVQVWNVHAEEMWGLRRPEVESNHLMNLDFGLPVEVLHAPVRSALIGEATSHELTVTAVNRRGRSIDVRIRTAALRHDDGPVVGVIVMMEEVPDEEQPAPG